MFWAILGGVSELVHKQGQSSRVSLAKARSLQIFLTCFLDLGKEDRFPVPTSMLVDVLLWESYLTSSCLFLKKRMVDSAYLVEKVMMSHQ